MKNVFFFRKLQKMAQQIFSVDRVYESSSLMSLSVPREISIAQKNTSH